MLCAFMLKKQRKWLKLTGIRLAVIYELVQSEDPKSVLFYRQKNYLLRTTI